MKKLTFSKLVGLILWLPLSTAYSQCPNANFKSTAPACQTDFVNFTDLSGDIGPGWTWSWQFDYPGGGGATPSTSTAQNPTGISYAPGGNGVYTVLLTIYNSISNCSSTVLINIDIGRARADFTTSASNTCVNDSVLVYNTGTDTSSVNANVTHYWSFGAGAVPSTSNLPNPPPIKYSTPGLKTIVHIDTVTYLSCGRVRQDLQTQNITVNPSPLPKFTSNAPVCQGSNVNFTYNGSSATSYSWDFGPDATPRLSNSQNPTGIIYGTPGMKKITLTVANSYGCSATDTASINILRTPVADFTSTAPKCTGLPVNFTNTGTLTGATYYWNFGAGATPATSSAQSPAGIVYSTSGIKLDTLITTLISTGCKATEVQTININQTPLVTFTSTAPKCAGIGVNFTNTGSSDSNLIYTWNFGADANPAGSTAENPTGISYSTGGNKTVTFYITGNGCSNSDTATILINSLPVAEAGKDTTICAAASVPIGSNSIAGNTYLWFPVNTLNNAAIANPVASPIAPVTQYVVKVTNMSTGCVNTDSVNITMLPPLRALPGNNAEICRNDSVQVGAALITGQSYGWNPSLGISNVTIANPYAMPDSTTTYTLTVTGSGCPLVTGEVTVLVHQLPKIEAGGPLDSISAGESIQLYASGGLQYTWSPLFALNDAGIYNPLATPSVTTVYIVNGIDVYGCKNSDSVTVDVLTPSFWIPNSFTPAAGVNNVLYVYGNGISNFQFALYNRFGERIFYSENMQNGWNGKKQTTGEDMPEGAYVYYITGTTSKGSPIHQTGMINLIR